MEAMQSQHSLTDHSDSWNADLPLLPDCLPAWYGRWPGPPCATPEAGLPLKTANSWPHRRRSIIHALPTPPESCAVPACAEDPTRPSMCCAAGALGLARVHGARELAGGAPGCVWVFLLGTLPGVWSGLSVLWLWSLWTCAVGP